MITFKIGEYDYKADKLTAFNQIHLSRKIGPLIPPLVPVFAEISRKPGAIMDNLDSLAPLTQPFMDALAHMSNEATEEIFALCLAVVKRQVGDHWADIWDTRSKQAMFDDLNDMSVLFKIAMKVGEDNLKPFIQGLLTSQQAEKAAA